MKNLILTLLFLLPNMAFAAGFKLESSSFKGTDQIPKKHAYNDFGCSGENISPALEWSNAPKGTKSFAVTVFDPDAPTGSGWWHWTVVNIPASVNKIEAGSSNNKKLPAGTIEGRSDYGKSGWGGPCPPPGETHNYIFTIFALKIEKLELDSESSGAMVGFNLNANSLGKAKMTIKYSR